MSIAYLNILLTILFTVYGQLVIKWQMSQVGSIPAGLTPKILFFGGLFLNPWILSGFMAAFLASLAWMAAMTKLELSYAYPFVSLSFVLVLVFSGFIFHEPITIYKVIGVLLIITGVAVSSHV